MSKMSKTIAVLGVVAGLGVAALPLSTYAETGTPTDPAKVNMNVKVLDSIAIAVEGDDTVNLTSVNGALVTEAGQTGTAKLRVTTGNSKGYTLWAQAESADGALTDGGSNTIPAGAPSTAAPVASAWGMKTNPFPGETSGEFVAWKGINGTSAAKNVVRTTTTAPTDTDGTDTYSDTEVTFGVTTAAGQAAGTYTGVVDFTAAANI